jgi:hypothetical protein
MDRDMGEPNEDDKAIIKVALNTGFHIQTVRSFGVLFTGID